MPKISSVPSFFFAVCILMNLELVKKSEVVIAVALSNLILGKLNYLRSLFLSCLVYKVNVSTKMRL